MRVFAPAKVNLALHVTGRRADGYHLLDSLVVFAGVGDWLDVERAETSRLTVTGPFAEGVPAGPENLIWKAHGLFADAPPLHVTLEKHLPHAAGIGGGSSDAAALLRVLSGPFGCAPRDTPALLSLGADLPVCLSDRPQRMSGIGETVAPVPALPPLDLVLVNPGVSVPTGRVFQTLRSTNGAPLDAMAWACGVGDPLDGFLAWLTAQRNDLEAPARAIAPEIQDTLDALSATEGCRLARMSGSGATCFGLYDGRRPDLARDAAARIASAHPLWWVQAAPVLQAGHAVPMPPGSA